MKAEPASENNEVAAPEYIRENFELSDRVAILVRDSRRAETTQRITTAENAASPDFQAWLRHKNVTSDVYIGMNSLKRDAQSRTKEDIDKIRHVYLDIDRRGPEALEAIRNQPQLKGSAMNQTATAVPDARTAAPEDEIPMTVREAAKFLGISQQTVYLWVERKQIPHLRVMGRNIRFLKSELDSFRASFKQEMENG